MRMSEAISTGDTRAHAAPASLRGLALCLIASLALHAWVLWMLPEWKQSVVIAPTPVFDVVMLSREMEVPAASPRVVPPENSRPEPARRQLVMRQPVPAAVVVPAVPVDLVQPPSVPLAQISVPVPLSTTGIQTASVPAIVRAPVLAPRGDPFTPPSLSAAYLRNPPPRYPLVAHQKGDEGQVTLSVLVSAAGVPVQVKVDHSSGSSPLDNAALDAVKVWRFVPARRGTQNIEAWIQVPVIFRLES